MVCIMLQMFRLTPQCYPVANNILNVEFLKSIRSNALSALIGVTCDNHRFHTQGALNENMFYASDIDTEQKRSLFYKIQSFRQHK